MAAVARTDLAGLDPGDRSGAAAYAVIGTLLVEPVLVSLRRLVQENLSHRRHARSRR